MSTTRLHHHPSLPAPVVHAGFSAHQSKSHVLAGVQDAYWSDDDADDADCPLCLEEMDISDLNFKPCVCGYQICRFCWHHIKQNLNGRCPACRREYSDDAVQFKPIAKEDHKRLTQQKKQRERERKELDALGRRHLANVRVVQRNVVYVVGIGPRFAKEELIPTLRSNDYFGQYGKISKILLVKRTSSGGGAPIVGLYITYHRREDAARCISTVDGAPSPGGGREVMRASYGTTKYCMAFLRGVSCTDHTCMNLHEWGDEKDCFTKEDLTTLKHTIKDTESRGTKNGDGLPRTAAWAKPTTPTPSSTTSTVPIAQRSRRGGQRQARTTRPQHDRKTGSGSTKTPSIASSSRPPTPAVSTRPASPPEVKTLRAKEPAPFPPTSPSPSMAIDSDDVGSGSPPSPPRPRSTESVDSTPAVPVSLPPGLPDAPPGLPPPTRTPKADPAVAPSLHAPQMSSGSYQISTAAQALLDDVKARREAVLSSTQVSIFPDFDRTLRMLSESEGGFSFNLDPKLADVNVNADGEAVLSALEAEARVPFAGGFMDAFPALKPQVHPHTHQVPTVYPHNPARSIYDPLAMRENYLGSFNPFGETEGPSTGSGARSSPSYPDEERKVSRFGFARGRQGSTAASSPVHVSSPLSASESHHSFFTASETPAMSSSHWNLGGHGEYAGYVTSSPLVSQAQTAQTPPQQHVQPQTQPIRFQPFDTSVSVSEAQLRELIQSSRERASSMQMHNATADQLQYQFAPFSDPAIMSARFASPVLSSASPSNAGTPAVATAAPTTTPTYGPPPGLAYPNITPSVSSSPSPAPALSSADFPALNADVSPPPDTQPAEPPSPAEVGKEQAKAERKAAKKAVAAERALERQKAAQEKAAAKAAEKARIAQEKAVEKEKLAKEKEEREKSMREKAEKDRVEKERLAQEKAAEEEKATEEERERKEKALAEKAQAEKARVLSQAKAQKAAKSASAIKVTKSADSSCQAPATSTPKQSPAPPKGSEPFEQAPILSKMPKKNKPVTRPIKIPKEDEIAAGDASATPSASVSEAVNFPPHKTTNTVVSSSNGSRAQSVDTSSPIEPTSLVDLLDDIDVKNPSMDLPNHPFFDMTKINPAAKMPLEYGPLVHALSALSVGGGSFATNMPSGSIDNAVSSFQQLLETLTQTISDLLRLLPRTTWDDSSSFDGVLRDMLKGDDFLDDGGDDAAGKEDEVAALTLALERRARWMEVQLSKLEELHRDINTAAVRAVLAFNDSGWDRHIFMPRVGNTLRRFDNIGMVEQGGKMRPMTVDELEKKLQVAKEAAIFAETEFREAMEKMQAVKPVEVDDY
ncbi:uncharacterized protein EDB91DRAFT_1111233 [Suillus paluster]|uniref:uncharacterized protein n=1 Tax=Suillus paluster TaxID=48578 RepID=UPI001B86681F|nr:uncharacterized protein EDB91DRAFT_1111233 [Suillus paluster]KAG1748888.1 hypothetical protein EDB91DRAFT_1111233 [Suillus paluster]